MENWTLRISVYFLNDLTSKKSQIVRIGKQATISHLPNFVSRCMESSSFFPEKHWYFKVGPNVNMTKSTK